MCQTVFCLPCTMANVFNKREYGPVSPGCDCAACCGASIMLYGTSGHYLQWAAMALRREMIQNYSINDESQCESCALGYFCFPCVFCQVQRELGKRGAHAEGCCASSGESLGSKLENAGKAAINELVQMAGTGGITPHVWSSGLCDCDAKQCCEGCCCPCCTYGYMGTKIDSYRMTSMMGVAAAAMEKMDPAACCGFLWFPQGWIYANRRELIERYQIIGESHCMTGLKTVFCPCCALMQGRREMGFCDEWAGGLLQHENPVPVKYGINVKSAAGGLMGKILS
jgi:Cys-rich protein (TIGR01571 family)